MYARHRDVLANGMRVVTVEVPHLHSAMVTLYVRGGSRHDHPARSGVSHFLEHILFRGCRGFGSSALLNAAIEDVGGSLNGVTTRDHGYYYTPVHPEGVSRVLEVISSMIAHPLLEEVEIEREVILEEILDEVDETGRLIDVDTISKGIIFSGHTLALPIAGSSRTVSGISTADLKRHHQGCYGAGSLVLSVAGPVVHEDVVRDAERFFGRIPRGPEPMDQPPPPFPFGCRVECVSHRESQSEVRMTFPAVAESHPDYPAQILLGRILDDGLTSRLQQEIVERRGLAYAISAGCDVMSDVSLFEIDASTTHTKVPRLISTIQAVLAAIVKAPPGEEELARAKTRHRYGIEFMHDSVGDLSGWFGLGELQDRPVSLEERIRDVAAVEAGRIQELAARLFRPDRRLLVMVGLADEAKIRAAVDEPW